MRQMALIVAAGGNGSRFGSEIPKQFMEVDGTPIIVSSILPFVGLAKNIIVSIADGYEDYLLTILPSDIRDILTVVSGGKTRYDSVKNALSKVPEDCKLVAIHDAARPYVDKELIMRVIESAEQNGAAIPVIPLVDSIRKIFSDGTSQARSRENYAFIQTPQIFDKDLLKQAYMLPYSPEITDDASLVEKMGHSVHTVIGSIRNIKITYRTDL